jgi:signal transduction histidine kinase
VHPLAQVLDHAPSPFAITGGPTHAVLYANRSFLRLVDAPVLVDVPIAGVLPAEAMARLGPLLDRAFAGGGALHDQFLGSLARGGRSWIGSIWLVAPDGEEPAGLAIALRVASHEERTVVLQKEIAERLLLSALREAEAADVAETSRASAVLLQKAGQRLGLSLDETATRSTIAGLSVPPLGAWCIVDVIEPDGEVTRLTMIHPDPEKQEAMLELAEAWPPKPGDRVGAPVVLANAQPLVTKADMSEVADALAPGSLTPDGVRLLQELVSGPLLTVPLVAHGTLLGAITFVSAHPGRDYTVEEIELAEALAARSAEALHSARLYGLALSLREQADASSVSRMRFLGNISHELRTPLNAIGGYVQLLEAGIRGPITDAQRRDLERISQNQQHLLFLITDILNFVRAGLTPVIEPVAMPLHAAVGYSFVMLEDLASRKAIHYRNEVTDPDIMAAADPDRVQQILINVISNAIKFTPSEGTITTRCEVTDSQVLISVTDTGIGIDPEKTQAIFEPFVQAAPKGEGGGGVGLGLAISRDLARAMRGDLTVESTPGEGSTFTLSLPRSRG